MEIAIAGAHGNVARHLGRLLHARGDRVRGLIRNPAHAGDLRADGTEPVVCDLEHAEAADVERAVAGCDVVVFAAGAGPGSGAERKLTVDRDGAITRLRGDVAREDVAATLAAVLAQPATRHVLYVVGGEDPVADALAAALA